MKPLRLKDKIRYAIFGLIVGDAIGVPYEFLPRDSFHASGMAGFGTHNQAPGTWSDDSSLTLATMASYIRKGFVDPEDIMSHYRRWLYKAEYTAHGKVFDVGRTTAAAIANSQVKPWEECGGRSNRDCGNGSLMRILPVAFMNTDNPAINTKIVSSLTHANPICICACWFYVEIARLLVQGKDKETAVEMVVDKIEDDDPNFHRLKNIKNIDRIDITSSAYVISTLEAALWCLLNGDSYEECILMAVNLGHDTDTTAAVTGGLAGIVYGVPEAWIDQLARTEWIERVIRAFAERCGCVYYD